jgi:hypothetical protein
MVLWTDALVFRSRAVLNEQVGWSERGDNTVVMSYLVKGERDEVEVIFDQEGKRMIGVRAMRYKSSKANEKTPWRVDCHRWGLFDGSLIPSKFSVTWGSHGKPWSVWNVDGLVLNPQLG